MHRFNYWLAIVLIFISSLCYADDTARLNIYFYKYSKMYFGNFDWQWFKAQGIVESNLKYDAVSPVGAKGIMQIMPATWKELTEKLNFRIDGIFDAEWNIAAGIYYNRYLWNFWKTERPLKDKLAFVFASYNGGAGNVLKAQKQCYASGTDCNLWDSVSRFANTVKTWKYRESLDYVDRIFDVKMKLDEADGMF